MTVDDRRLNLWQLIYMKKMLLLSMLFHLTLAALLLMASSPWRQLFDLPPTYQVNLVSFSEPPKQKIPVLVKRIQPPIQKPVIEKKPEPQKENKVVMNQVELLKTTKRDLVKPETPSAIDQKTVKKSQETAAIPPVPSVEAGVDVKDFKFPFYLKLIQRQIGSVWSPPSIEIGGKPREVVVSFILIATGKIREINVEKSSGNPFFDQAALRAIYMADPLPPLPIGFMDPNLKVNFSFSLIHHG